MERRAGFGERGTALVEFAILGPLIAILVGVAFTGWSALQTTVGLTSAARAGAIKAASDYAGGASLGTARCDARDVINSEENTTIFQCTNPAAAFYVTVTPPGTSTSIAASGTSPAITMNIVTVSISKTVSAFTPIAWNIPVSASATARY